MNYEERLRHAIAEISDRVREDVARQLHELVPTLAQELTPAQPAPSPEPVAAIPAPVGPQSNETPAGLAGIREMDDARSLSGVLETLVWAASREAARACVLTVRDDMCTVFSAQGCGEALEARLRTEPVRFPLSRAGLVRSVLSGRDAQSSNSIDSAPADLGAPVSFGCAVAAPLVVGGQAVAVLYADIGKESEPEDSRAAALPAVLEVLARHASRCLEAITAFRTTQLFTGSGGDTDSVTTAGRTRDWTEDDGEAARRYARLLISEIKLYHENAVIAGRRDRNLASRLGGEIARARMLYEQRVPAGVERRADYFDAEIVRTLANGDPALLGNDADTGGVRL